MQQRRFFYLFALLSLALLYILFVVGASVRASGAGMGCPDWPTCFGQWVPPTSASQLPDNYQEIYAHRGYKETQFNAVKTWTEYGNRLTSALLGACVFAMLVFAVLARRQVPKSALIGAVGAFASVAVNAWLGSIVVASNLHPAVITSHLFFSLVALGCMLLTLLSLRQSDWLAPKQNAKTLLFVAFPLLCVVLVQLGLGTQVRALLENNPITSGVLFILTDQNTSTHFMFHASVGIGLFVFCLALCVLLLSRNMAYDNKPRHQILATLAMIAVSVNVIIGMVLAVRGMAWLQPVHLLMATIVLGCIVSLCIISLMSLMTKTRVL